LRSVWRTYNESALFTMSHIQSKQGLYQAKEQILSLPDNLTKNAKKIYMELQQAFDQNNPETN